MKPELKIKKEYPFSKIGVDEIEGLTKILTNALKPVQKHLLEHIYWGDLAIEPTEYKSRDGFIPYSHNCGGVEISVIIPRYEQYNFGYLEFGECDECSDETQCGYEGKECAQESEFHLDAKLRIWLKFEGIEDGEMSFYLYAGGGNGDAPYFRTAHEQTVFETTFTAKTLKQVEHRAAKAIKQLLKKLK